MAKSPQDWNRWHHYQKTGEWLPTQKQVEAAEAKKRQERVNLESQKSALGINPNVSDKLAREILDWDKNNPDNAKYDNDGNPVEND